jgi:peptidyl-prolyl cis-trans isomerase D
MAGLFENKQVLTRIFIGIFVGLIAVSMLLYLVPQGPNAGAASTDTVAMVGGQSISLQDIQQQLTQISQRGQIPKPLESLYARQILNQLVFEKEIQYEADRLNITVTNEELATTIKQILPTAFNGDSPVGMDQYSAQVQQRFQMPVAAFEAALRNELLMQKFQKLVTDGVSASPAELKDQFNYQNQKVKLDYAFVKPEDLEAKISPDDAELKAHFEKNKTKYQEPERRSVRYALLDVNRIKQATVISDEELNRLYNRDKTQFQVPNRVHVQHILLFTRGKNTEAEITEVQKRAEEVLKEVKKGGKFEDLAKKYSEDTQTKEKGGDLGWIVQGQTVASFEKAAFSTPKGATSDVVKTEYGFHIIKVLDKETAHTLPLDEVYGHEQGHVVNIIAIVKREAEKHLAPAEQKKYQLSEFPQMKNDAAAAQDAFDKAVTAAVDLDSKHKGTDPKSPPDGKGMPPTGSMPGKPNGPKDPPK